MRVGWLFTVYFPDETDAMRMSQTCFGAHGKIEGIEYMTPLDFEYSREEIRERMIAFIDDRLDAIEKAQADLPKFPSATMKVTR